jgi:hypothetical protein
MYFMRRVERPKAEEGAEKVAVQTKSVPQRLKPHCKKSTYGTAEAVPLSKTDFFSILFSLGVSHRHQSGL